METKMQQTPTRDVADLMADIARLAPLKNHHLAKDMVNGSRPLARQAAEKVLAHLEGLPDRESSEAPRPEPAPAADLDQIPVGYYATPSRTGSNDVDFWKVERPEDGKFEGWTFVKRVLGGGSGGQTRLTKIRMPEQRSALAAIAGHGVEEARNLYGDKMKRCTNCNRELTDDLSRARRMGKDCWENKQGALWRSTLGPGPPSLWRSWPFGLQRPGRTRCSSPSAGAARSSGCATGWRAPSETPRSSATRTPSWRG
jgi:hypothetical protein